MNKVVIDLILVSIIPMYVVFCGLRYKKASKDYKLTQKDGFRTEYSIKNIYNWRKVNYLAYKVSMIEAIVQSFIILILFSIKLNIDSLFILIILIVIHIIFNKYIIYKSDK
ncbi:hypothetical protein [Oceanivirga miroungae]|uniref:SdpI family protein n=1 Tax=Oceanivirga miroungae TaxID=1130046 RepID=A0A6I8MEW5_9FUSO|nr:hypothetical protein [Oceanivirga miroungae]VWL85645.1 hypothetical protein OMES3154_00930 [Oceanivirga miroungae]